MKSFWTPVKLKSSVWKMPSKLNNKPVKILNTNIYPKRTRAEVKLIDKNPFGDSDKDRVPNWFDCKPLNKYKQGFLTRSTKKTVRRYAPQIRKYLAGSEVRQAKTMRDIEEVESKIEQSREEQTALALKRLRRKMRKGKITNPFQVIEIEEKPELKAKKLELISTYASEDLGGSIAKSLLTDVAPSPYSKMIIEKEKGDKKLVGFIYEDPVVLARRKGLMGEVEKEKEKISKDIELQSKLDKEGKQTHVSKYLKLIPPPDFPPGKTIISTGKIEALAARRVLQRTIPKSEKGKHVELDIMYVLPEERGKGIAKKVIRSYLKQPKLEIMTGTATSRRLFENLWKGTGAEEAKSTTAAYLIKKHDLLPPETKKEKAAERKLKETFVDIQWKKPKVVSVDETGPSGKLWAPGEKEAYEDKYKGKRYGRWNPGFPFKLDWSHMATTHWLREGYIKVPEAKEFKNELIEIKKKYDKMETKYPSDINGRIYEQEVLESVKKLEELQEKNPELYKKLRKAYLEEHERSKDEPGKSVIGPISEEAAEVLDEEISRVMKAGKKVGEGPLIPEARVKELMKPFQVEKLPLPEMPKGIDKRLAKEMSDISVLTTKIKGRYPSLKPEIIEEVIRQGNEINFLNKKDVMDVVDDLVKYELEKGKSESNQARFDAGKLMALDSQLWKSLKIESGTHLDSDPKLKEKYIQKIIKEVGSKKYSPEVFDILENENYHSINEQLLKMKAVSPPSEELHRKLQIKREYPRLRRTVQEFEPEVEPIKEEALYDYKDATLGEYTQEIEPIEDVESSKIYQPSEFESGTYSPEDFPQEISLESKKSKEYEGTED